MENNGDNKNENHKMKSINAQYNMCEMPNIKNHNKNHQNENIFTHPCFFLSLPLHININIKIIMNVINLKIMIS